MISSELYFSLPRTVRANTEQLQLNVDTQIASISLNFLFSQSVLRFPLDVYGFCVLCSLISFGQKYTRLLRRSPVQSNSDVEHDFFFQFIQTRGRI